MNIEVVTNKVAIITGGTGGLGRELARTFFENSYRVIINFIKSERTALQFIEAMGEKALAIKADVSNFKEVLAIADDIYRRYGRVDVLVNNAGIVRDSLLIKQREEDWDRILNVNLKGVFNCINAFAPLMKKGGHIINISSYSGLKGKEGQAAYSSSKAALLGLTKTAAIELAEYKIKVNAILPGYLPTEMGLKAEEAMERAKAESLLSTLSCPKEVARFILYLAETENITGQTFCLESRIV